MYLNFQGASAPLAPYRAGLSKMKYSDDCASSYVGSEYIWLYGSLYWSIPQI